MSVPERQCSGCREHKPKTEMLRVLRKPDGEIVFDFKSRAPGRGVYVCRNAKCLAKARKSRVFERQLKSQIPAEIYAALDGEIPND